MNEITRLFIDEHASMNALLKAYVKTNDVERKKIFMHDVQRQLFAHFKEEELYYSKYDKKMGETFLTLKRLISEHEMMRDMIQQKDFNIKRFVEFIVVHEHIEEDTIYPELEKFITREDIHELVKKLTRQ